jgi:N-acetylneuraminic acid mutarotase
MKKLIFLIIILPSILFSQQWDQASSFISNGRHHPITFANNNFGFVMAGSYLDDAYKYDKSNDTWTQLQNVPFSGRGYSYGVTIGNKAYMGLGSTSNGSFPNDWWEYDMDNDSWLQRANLPTDGRNHPAMIAIGDKIYMGCGSNSSNLNDWWEYDANNDSWTQKADLPAIERHHPFYFGINNIAYVGFGHSNSGIEKDFFKYNPNNDTWTQLNDFPGEARVAGTQFSYNGKGYILSGDGDDHGPLDTGEFWEYESLDDSWTQLPSHPGGAIWAPGNFVIDCDVYFLLGQNWNASTPTDPITVYKYKLNDDCGCTDILAYNYSNAAIFDDGSCCLIAGCTDPLALNYDSLSCFDDESCIAPVVGCSDPSASNFDPNANTAFAFGGELDNNFSSGGYFNGNQHLVFNSSKDCIIKSAIIDSEGTNTITFELRNNSGTVIDNTTISVVSGEQLINLDFNVPIGNDMQLGLSNNALQTNGLYRNNANANYPYDIGSAVSITGSSANANPYDYYYFFYNIEIEILCDGISSINNVNSSNKLVKVLDILGKAVETETRGMQFYIYEDGTVEKKIIIE